LELELGAVSSSAQRKAIIAAAALRRFDMTNLPLMKDAP
jgi:hypothetical protein